MSVWGRVAAIFKDFRGHAPGTELTPAEQVLACAPDPGDVGFTVAVIGLAAKMARADGAVTQDEAAAAAQIFRPPPGEEVAFRRAFRLAQSTILGFEGYAEQIGKRYRGRPCLLEDVLDGLFHIAAADGAVTPAETAYIEAVSQRFGFSPTDFRRIKASNLGLEAEDPYAILGLSPGADLAEVRHAWRQLAAEHHPDQMLARGAPAEFIELASEKSRRINAAYEMIKRELSAGEAEAAH